MFKVKIKDIEIKLNSPSKQEGLDQMKEVRNKSFLSVSSTVMRAKSNKLIVREVAWGTYSLIIF